MTQIVVTGIGQSLRGDDAAGLEAVRRWAEDHPSTSRSIGIRVETSETPGLSLLDTLEGSDAALVVDAVRSGAPPGTVHLLEADDVHAFGDGSGSAHGWGAAETLALGRKIHPESMPPRIVVIGIEAGKVGVSEGLSPPVRDALPTVSRLIQQEVLRLLLV